MVESLNSHKTLKEVKELQLWKYKNVGAKYGPNHIKSFEPKGACMHNLSWASWRILTKFAWKAE